MLIMKDLYIGLICLCFGFFLFFYSSKDARNMLGYKSLQLNTHKDIWKWTNECFGLLTLFGSVVYLAISVYLAAKDLSFPRLPMYGLIYIVISFITTECYAFIKKYKNGKIKTPL